MTTVFRIETVQVQADGGAFAYEFPGPLTVLAGQSGVGKSSLLQLVKYGLGGNGHLARVAREHVSRVTVIVTAGTSRLAISRAVSSPPARTVQVTDVYGDGFQIVPVDGDDSVGNVLLRALGLPVGLHARARSKGSTSRGATLTFWDVFNFLYVSQRSINQDIAGSRDSYYEPKRRTVFEMLFDLIDVNAMEASDGLAAATQAFERADSTFRSVVTFLTETNTTSRAEALKALVAARESERNGEERLVQLRDEMRDVEDTETDTIRLLLASSEELLSETVRRSTELQGRVQELSGDLQGVQGELGRLSRLRDATGRIADIEFRDCPRCMQSIRNRETESGVCRLCLQPEAALADTSWDDSYEQRQLTEQEAELKDAIASVTADLARYNQEVGERRQAVTGLSAALDDRTRSRISPRLQAFDDANRAVATAKERQESLERVLLQWDRAQDLEVERNEQAATVAALERVVMAAQARLAPRKAEIIEALSDEFRTTMESMLGTRYDTLTIDPDSYLPYLNGARYDKTELAGGILTVTQIAYWLALITVALRRQDTLYPAFLLLDSPRTSLNEEESIVTPMYAKLATLADANQNRLQFIVADNELPNYLQRDFQEIDFDFQKPTFATVKHPGPGVPLIDEELPPTT